MNEKTIAVGILHALFVSKYEHLSYGNVDDFYGYLGYTLEVSHLLLCLGVNGTSDLLIILKEFENKQ